MLSSQISVVAILAFTTLLSPTASQLNLPSCIRNCIDSSNYANCQVTDIACLCRASSSNFLPDLVTCMDRDCIELEPSILLGPLQFACQLAGAPIPDDIMEEAENAHQTNAPQATTTVAQATITKEYTSVTSVTVTTTERGRTIIVVYPITIERTTTVSGEPSTITRETTRTATAPGGVVPVVLTTTDEDGSTYTTTTTQTTTASTGTTDAAGSGTTAESSETSSVESTTTILTSTTVAGQAFTSTDPAGNGGSQSTTTTSAGRPASETNSSPFTNTNDANDSKLASSWMALAVLAVVGTVWL